MFFYRLAYGLLQSFSTGPFHGKIRNFVASDLWFYTPYLHNLAPGEDAGLFDNVSVVRATVCLVQAVIGFDCHSCGAAGS
jgi:hypothetical protein